MVMRAMRDSAKWVMLLLSLAFVGWLVLDWVEARTGGGGNDPNPVVGVVGGRDVRLSEWNLYLQGRMEAARAQTPGAMTDEDRRRVEEAAWDEMVSEILVRSELDRLGIRVSDAEVRRAFQTEPPEEFLSHPAFQTDGEFDIQKYRQYFSGPTVDENLLLQLEDYYRRLLPERKLRRHVAAAVHVSEADAWEYFRDRNERVRVRFVSLEPAELVAEDAVEVSGEEVRAYYRSHRDEFRRAATATVSVVNIAAGPSAADTAATRARADSLRQAIASGEATFEDVARAESADSRTVEQGGELGRVRRGQLVEPLEEAAFSLPVGRVSDPVATSFGFHLVRVDERDEEEASIRHILVPVEMSPATEDSLFTVIDRLEGVALDRGLAEAADSVGLTVRREIVLTRESEFVPGAGTLGVAVDWAFDPITEPGELSPFFENASGFHVLELHSREPAGIRELAEVEPEIRRRLEAQKRKERARDAFAEAVREIRAAASLEEIAERHGWEVRVSEAFSRVDFVPGLGQGTEAIGAAFALPVGGTTGVVDAGERLAVLQVVSRESADRQRFEEIKAALVQQLMLQRQQEYVERWLAALRERAQVRDLRDQLSAATATQAS